MTMTLDPGRTYMISRAARAGMRMSHMRFMLTATGGPDLMV